MGGWVVRSPFTERRGCLTSLRGGRAEKRGIFNPCMFNLHLIAFRAFDGRKEEEEEKGDNDINQPPATGGIPVSVLSLSYIFAKGIN